MKVKFKIIKKFVSSYNKENWSIIYLIMITVIIEIIVKMIVMLMNKDMKVLILSKATSIESK